MSDNTPKDKDSLDPEKIKELNDKVDSIKENIRKGVEELKKTEALINAQNVFGCHSFLHTEKQIKHGSFRG